MSLAEALRSDAPIANDQDREYIHGLNAAIRAASDAKRFINTEAYEWIDKTILASMEEEAIEKLARATTEQDRIIAQQMLLAARKPKDTIMKLIRQGDAAKETLLKLSTLEEDDNV